MVKWLGGYRIGGSRKANLKYHYPRRRFTHSIGWGTLGCESPELFLDLAKGDGTDAATGEGLRAEGATRMRVVADL